MAEKVAAARKGGGAQLRAPKREWTPALRNRFLAELAQTANVRGAVRAVGLSEPGAYKLRKRDAAFAAAWGQALCEGYDKLEMLLLERALAGLDGDRVPPGDASRIEKLSERTLLSMLAHHRQTVRDLREAAARAQARPAADEDAEVRARLEAKLDEMHERMSADDGG